VKGVTFATLSPSEELTLIQVFSLSPEDGNIPTFQNNELSKSSEYCTMDKVQNPSDLLIIIDDLYNP
jgi:hypothetical protein